MEHLSEHTIESRPVVPRTVLLAEDDNDLRDVLAALLHAEGYDVVLARTGPEAVAAAQRGALFAAVVDVHLPNLGGVRVAEILQGKDPSLRVVLMSGHHDAPRPAGTRLLDKPFSAHELLALLRDAPPV